ncbi:MAG: protein-export chaperone SecB [Lachnospiraceae bacterium]|nr:protein-export chaperone SecB [Lachnospiraceae bacterium]
MKKSDLQFSNPHLEQITFKTKEISKSIEDDIPIEINIQVIREENINEAVVQFHIMIGELDMKKEESKYSVFLDATTSANFKWNDNLSDNIENMLRINGGAVLLSYIRPIIASLTMQAGIQPLHLPFVNFTE